MVDIIAAEPGITVGDLQAAMGLAPSSFFYHLDRLRESGLVADREDEIDARLRHLYVGSGDAGEHGEPVSELSEPAREIALVIAMNPGSPLARIIELARVNPRNAYYHVRRLVADELVTAASDTRYVGLRGTSRLYKILGLPEPGKPRNDKD
jgi:DNA-binding transcriptional ArsR family regulator